MDLSLCMMTIWTKNTLALLVLLFSASSLSEKVSYEGYQLYELRPVTEVHLHYLLQLEDSGFDFWSPPRGKRPPQLLLGPDHYTEVTTRFTELELEFTVAIPDVQSLIDSEFDYGNSRSKRSAEVPRSAHRFVDKFNSHEEINEWLEQTYQYCRKQKTLSCNLYSIGTTHEGRVLKAIRVGRKFYRYPRLSVWIDGGTHAREWISPAMAVNIIDKLVYGENSRTNSSGCDKCLPHLVDMYDFYILPVVNPDGYDYTQTNRLWRKNRRPNVKADAWWSRYARGRYSSVKCYGVDLNRNFGYHWGESGTSSNACSDVYGGKMAFSERETQAVRRFISSRLFNKWSNRLYMFITLHSYGQYILYPWGHTSIVPHDASRLHHVATEVDRVQRNCHGTHYRVGSAAKTLYAASGGSDDWAKGSMGVPFAYTVELPPGEDRAAGTNGFILPEKSIPLVVGRFWPGLEAMLNSALSFARETLGVYNRYPRSDCPGQYRCSCACQKYKDVNRPTPWCQVEAKCSRCV